MSTKSMAYDHPAYTSVRGLPMGAITGNAGKSTKYAAFTAETIKAAILHVEVAGTTSGDVLSLITITGTTTTTTALLTAGSANPAAGVAEYLPLATAIQMAQGDEAYMVKGADATLTYASSLEVVTLPLASVTV